MTFTVQTTQSETLQLNTPPKLGDSSLIVLQYIAQYNKLDEITLFRHTVGVNWRQLYNDNEKINHLNVDCFAHNDNKVLESVKVDSSTFGKLTTTELIKRSGQHEVFSVGSLVTRDSQKLHIPMMNFHPEVGEGKKFILNCLKSLRHTYPELISPGVLVASGRYFHYYGFNLINEHALSKFLSHFLMPAILVSPRYIGHSLYEEQCSLRVTADTKYKPYMPIVVATIN